MSIRLRGIVLILTGIAFMSLPAIGSPAGAVSRVREFPIPNPFSDPFGITAGPDGNLWFTEGYADEIGRITPAEIRPLADL